MDSGLQQHFCAYVRLKLVDGVNGKGETVPYIPPSTLENYWSQANVNEILDSHEPQIRENATFIVQKFRQIFSILVFINRTREISWFCSTSYKNLSDNHLPFDNQDLPQNCTWSKEFLETQWMFSPLVFTHDIIFKRTLHSKIIMPVVYEKRLTDSAGGSDAAALWRVRMQSECTLPIPKPATVVFKIYEGTRAQRLFKVEADAYGQLLRSNNEGYITKHFASFSFQGIDKSIIVLEYAEGGSLLDFLRQTNPPVKSSEFCLLWSRLLNLFDSLHILNEIYRPPPFSSSSHWSLTGVHQDIQPSNILAFPQKNTASRFDVNFKLADFGLAEIGRISVPGDSLTTKKRGNRMYNRAKTEISTASDIWSLGAVFSDVLVWSIAGEDGREDYRQARKKEISNKPHLRAKDYDACFHDGTSRLATIQEFHNDVLQNKRDSDHISPYMSDLIIEFMLTDRLQRLNAMQIKLRADEKIKRVSNGSWEEIPRSPVSLNGTWRPPSSIILPQHSPETGPLGAKSDIQAEIIDLPGMLEARSKIAEAKGRDQIMLVDNFSSMDEHKAKAMRTARVISYVAKIADDNGMELFAASETTKKPRICTKSTQIEKAIGRMKTVKGKCDMQKSLGDILDRVLIEGRFRPTSIYIYTDGVWEPGDDRVETLINRAIDFLHAHRYKSSALMFQFIRFGSDTTGTERLKHLDNECKKVTSTDDYDIVDAKHCDDHVPDIVIGSISRWHDEKT
ncbi:serine threonine kinase [Fusarium beomiforme]|uniref:Serine threonine kinase n=1 Tax=Fusarium beomiforme TaxID=44412 RepID=A0A9P5ALX1_9HYPO|nr:serine threonine kinase [Fusarium beomiforme]